MAADVVLTEKAREGIKDLKNAVITARLWKLIDRLRNWPNVSGAKPLRGELAGQYRMRTGDYRIQFRVVTKKPDSEDEREPLYVVIIDKAGHRDGFYEE